MNISSVRPIFLVFALIGIGKAAFTQDAPVTTCGSGAMAAPGNIDIPVSVTGFNNIGAISLTLEYDHAVVQFVQGTPHPQLSGFVTGDADLGNGFHRISMGWYGSGTTLPDGSVIITLTFHYSAGNAALTWFDNGPSCQYADGNFNILNDLPTGTFYINGHVCALVGAPGPIAGDDTICRGDQGIIYSISQVPDATGYTWSVPPGAVIVSGQGTNSISVDYTSGANSGTVAVFGYNACGNGTSSELTVTVNDLPEADAGEDFSINYGTSTMLQAAPGGPGTYSYHWSPEELLVDPDMQNPQTVILTTTTLFTLQVTDQGTLCQAIDQVVVTVTGGPLSVNPVVVPESICAGGSAQLHANAGGGSGNYAYLWTSIPAGNPPWSSTLPDPLVSPDSSRHYLLEVNDGFTMTGGTADLLVNQLPTATISGGDTLCGYGLTTLVTVELTGVPPWNFTYAFGNTSVFVYNQATSPYSFLTGDPGNYTVTYIEDVHCTGFSYGSAAISVFPVPVAPEIYIDGMVLSSSACCGNQWYMDDVPIPGATGQFFTVTQSGEYYDVVTLNGCSSDPSETIDVMVGIGERGVGRISIYPNPAGRIVHIGTEDMDMKLQSIKVFSIDGKLIKDLPVLNSFSGAEYTLDLGNLSPGLFFIVAIVENAVAIEKVMIK